MTQSIVAFGEVLWDLLPAGKQLGGAAANFTHHCRSLGSDARLISRVGDDSLGRELRESLGLLGFPTETVDTDPDLPTGTVAVSIAPDGQPHFTIREGVAWDRISVNPGSLALAAEADAVYFGSLSQRSEPARTSIRSLISAARPKALRLFDVNLRPPFVDRQVIADSLRLANAVKLNDHEMIELAAMFELPPGIPESMTALADRFALDLVALTRGSRGSLLLAGKTWSDHPGRSVEVMDTIGAGDAFTAAMVVGYLDGRSLDEINRQASEVAAFVCSRPGGMPDLPESLRYPSKITMEARS